MVADYDGADKLVAEYVTPMLDQNLSMTRYDTDNAAGSSTSRDKTLANGEASTREMPATASCYYYSADGLGSVRTLTDTEGSVVENYDYLAFGEEVANRRQEAEDRQQRVAADTGSPGGSFSESRVVNSSRKRDMNISLAGKNRYTYTGRERSSLASAPMYYRYRMYVTGIGRFDKRDPIKYEDGDNLYAYVSNRPVKNNDWFGLSSCCNTKKYDSNTSTCCNYQKSLVTNNSSQCCVGGVASSKPTYIQCVAKCVNKYKLDIPGTIANVTGNVITNAGMALNRGSLDLTSGVRAGLGRKAHSTSWTHFIGSKLKKLTGVRAFKVAGKAAGRALTAVTVFEGYYDIGIEVQCAGLCASNTCRDW